MATLAALGHARRGFLVGLLGVLPSCSTTSPCNDPSSSATCPTSTGDVVASPPLPEATADEMMQWIETLVSFGPRRPGYAGDDAGVEWAVAQLERMGLKVEREPVDALRWESDGCVVRVSSAAGETPGVELPCFAMPHSTPTTGIEGEVVDDREGADLRGKVALYELHPYRVPQRYMKTLATDWYDPEDVFDSLLQTMPFGARSNEVMVPAVEGGAIALLGVLTGYPRETTDYYVPYDGVSRPIPGVWVSPASGARIAELRRAGPVVVRIAFRGQSTPARSVNLVARLEGASKEWIVVGTHHDAPWASAVEDASGMALVLAQARHWVRVPKEERPHNLLFLMNAGHMVGAAGLRTFLRQHADVLASTVVAIHLEHVARAVEEGPNGTLVATADPEVRWWFVSPNALLERLTKDAVVAEGLRRSLLLGPTSFPVGSSHPPTDGAFFYPDVPILQHLAAPVYLFDSADAPAMVHRESLEPLTRAVTSIVNGLRGETAASIRAGLR